MNLDPIELIHTFGEAMGLAAIFFTNIIFIRSFMLVSSCVFLITGYFVGLKAMAIWSFFYIIINAGQIALLLRGKKKVELSPEEENLWRRLNKFSREEISQIFALGTKELIFPHKMQALPADSIRFIHQGQAHAYKEEQFVESVAKDHFMGQLDFFHRLKKPLVWRNDMPICTHRWPYQTLEKLQESNPALYSKFINEMSYDVLSRSGI